MRQGAVAVKPRDPGEIGGQRVEPGAPRRDFGSQVVDSDQDQVQRALRIQLLRDLIKSGLYRVRPDELAERMLEQLGPDLGMPD